MSSLVEEELVLRLCELNLMSKLGYPKLYPVSLIEFLVSVEPLMVSPR